MSESNKILSMNISESNYPKLKEVYSPIIEYNFSWDEAGMKLADLWTAFEIAFCEKKAYDCQEELYQFIDLFIEVYKEWKPTEIDDDLFYPTEFRNATGDYKHSIAQEVSQTIGHPFRFIRGLINWIKCMNNDNKEMKDFHKIETVIEIVSRSPHNRVLLRYNGFTTILFKWLATLASQIPSVASNEDIANNCYTSLINTMHIIYNFLPSLHTCSWLTLESVFTHTTSNMMKELSSVFDDFTSLEGHNECIIDVSLELMIIISKLYAMLCIHPMHARWVVLLHQLILINCDDMMACHDTQRENMILTLINTITKNSGEWLFGRTPVNTFTDKELISLNVDFTILLMIACNKNEQTRQEAAGLGCYHMINQVFIYLIKSNVAKQLIQIIVAQEGRQALTVSVPRNYEMKEEGINTITPDLFKHVYSRNRMTTNLVEESKKLVLSGFNNTFVDVICRFLVSAVIFTDNMGQTVINQELFEQYLITFNNIEVFDEASRNIVESILLSVLRCMCKFEPSLYTVCLHKKLIRILTSSKFLVKIDATHFTQKEENSMISSYDEDTNGEDVITLFVRESLMNFIFDLLKNGNENDRFDELNVMLKGLVNNEYDELCIISLCDHLHLLLQGNIELQKSINLPQFLIYCIFSSNHESPLTWSAKYAIIQLLDYCLCNIDIIEHLILSASVLINNNLVNAMEYLFNLIDSKKTTEFGAAVIMTLLLRATEETMMNDQSFGQIMNIFVNMGTSLSRVHAQKFTLDNTYILHMLLNMVDYLLLEKKSCDPALTRARQDMLCKTNSLNSDFLIHCFSIITTTEQSESYFSIVYHMLFTMYLMLHNNPEFYKEFRNTVQDDQFTSVIVAGEDGYPTNLLHSLFNLLVDRMIFNTFSFYNEFPDLKNYVIKMIEEEENVGLCEEVADVISRKNLINALRINRPDFLRVIMYFVLRTNEQLQCNSLLFLKSMLESKNEQLNLIAITSESVSLVDLLLNHLEEFNPKIINIVLDIIRCVAKHNITVQQLKKIFKLLHPQDNHRARYTNHILMMLNDLYAAVDASKPDQSYLLVPPESGIKIKSTIRVPTQPQPQVINGLVRFPSSGYSLSIWFNLASLYADWILDGEHAVPHLFSFIEGETAFFVCIQKGALTLKYYQNGREVELPEMNTSIEPQKWYHLVISQSYSKLQKVHPLFISLNGITTFECVLPYPTFNHNVRTFIGTRGVDVLYTSMPTSYTQFNGELGTVYMMNKALNKDQARALYLLGPNYMFNFENMETENRPLFDNVDFTTKDRELIRQLCTGSLSSSLLINLSSCVMNQEKTCVLDNTPPHFRYQKWGLPMSKQEKQNEYVESVDGEILQGTYACSTKQISSVVDALGGISLFFPLLPQLDLLDYDVTTYDYKPAEVFTQECYSLVCNAIISSSSSKAFMEKQKGIDIIVYLLQKSSPYDITSLLIEKLILLLENKSLSKELHEQIFKAFFLNSALWIYCDVTVQQQVYNYMLTVLQANENQELVSIIRNVGIEGFSHIIRYFYNEMEIEVSEELNDDKQMMKPWLAMNDEIKHPITQDVVATKPSIEDKKTIRSILFTIIDILMMDPDSVTKTAMYNIVNCIEWCHRNHEDELLMAFLSIFDKMIHMEGKGVYFIQNMAGFSHISLDMKGDLLQEENEPMPEIRNDETVKAGILPFFLSLFTMNNNEITKKAIELFLYCVSLCEHSNNCELWTTLGVSRMNSHTIMDFIASHCSKDVVDETLVVSLLQTIVNSTLIEDNDNLSICIIPLVPLFFQFLHYLSEDLVQKYYSLFTQLFTNINASTNLNQFLSLPDWSDYLFAFVCRIRDEMPSILDPVWSGTQTLLLGIIVSSIEKSIYHKVESSADIKKDEESVKLLTTIFSSIKRYIGMQDFVNSEKQKSYMKGFYADFYILIVNRIMTMLGMPGDKTSFVLCIQPVIKYLFENLVYLTDCPEDEDDDEIERDHYNWQLISPFNNLCMMIIECISQINNDALKDYVNAVKKDYFTYDITLLVRSIRRYNMIINDHCEIMDEALFTPADESEKMTPQADLLGGAAPASVPASASASAPQVDLLGMPVQQQQPDLLGGVAPVQQQPDLLGMPAQQPDLLGMPTQQPDLLGMPTQQPDLLGGVAPMNQDQMSPLDLFSNMSVSPVSEPAMLVTTPMKEAYKPLYNEGIQICKQLKLLLCHNLFPIDSIIYLSRLNDMLRTIQSECLLLTADDFKGLLIEMNNIVLKLVETKAREILKYVDEKKPKRKWLLTDKQKNELSKAEAIVNDMLVLPPECWAEKNTHLCKAIELLQLQDPIVFLIDVNGIKQQLDEAMKCVSNYVINGARATHRIDTAINYCRLQEKNHEIRVLKEGSRNYWRKQQLTVKKWSVMIDSLIHERGPWGEMSKHEGILTLTSRLNERGMHQILIKDPEGSIHADASVWNDTTGEEIEKEEEQSSISNLMRSSVEDDLNEEQSKLMELESSSTHQSRIVFSAECLMILPMLAVRGKLVLSTTDLSFTVSDDFAAEYKQRIEKQDQYMANNKRIEGCNKYTMLKLPENKIWNLNELTHEEYRLYLFRKTAVELFFRDSSSAFFSFTSPKSRSDFHMNLRHLRPAHLTEFLGETAAERMSRDDSTRKWLSREISTFDYLMRLNRLAGRTYNDLSQYYIFPWVIADYTSPTIDLKNPKIYRDFNYPMGAQLPYRREVLMEKFEVMKENYQQKTNDIEDHLGILCPPPRFFSTHYSNSANVLWYLIRLEPYTSLHIFLQDGKFDRPDRQFWSMRNTYNGCTTNDGDVKELIPEFFYLPEFLKNTNKINLGTRQDSAVPINDVQLPPWAKTAEDFIRINRDALESEYVSANLHKWIDLIFGFKQRGNEAEACYNVFSHVTYYDSLDMETLYHQYPGDWQQAADMLENFGQTPLQLFGTPHHQRLSIQLSLPMPLLSYRNWFTSLGCHYIGVGTSSSSLLNNQVLALYKTNIKLNSSVMAIGVNSNTSNIITISKTRELAINPVKQQNGRSTPFDIGTDSHLRNHSCPIIAEPFTPHFSITKPSLQSNQLMAVSHNGQFVCVVGQWDHSLKLIHIPSGNMIMSIATGQEDLTCVAISTDDSMIITGSYDNSVGIYYIQQLNGIPHIKGYKTLYGHDDVVTCVAINKELNLICSGSRDGTTDTCYLRTMRDDDYDKRLPAIPAISWCDITSEGNIVYYSEADFKFHLYNTMGEKLQEKEMNSQLNSIILSNDKQYVIAGGDKITVFMMRLYDFAVVNNSLEMHYGGEGRPALFEQIPNLHIPVRSIHCSPDEQYIFLGLENGEVCVIAVKA